MRTGRGKSILLVTFHFPPIQGSSGVLRVLSFLKRLQKTGWDITVLTAPSFAYKNSEQSNLKSVPAGIKIVRAFSLHNAKHLSLRGKYLHWLSVPDNWASWIPAAFLAGSIQIMFRRPALLFTTYPIPSALVVSLLLKKVFRLPLIADFRDPMLQDDYPRAGYLRQAFSFIERKTVLAADVITVTTPGSRRLFLERYGDIISEKLHLIENGVDTLIYQKAKESLVAAPVAKGPRKVLLHSGLVYPIERNPSSLFHAIAEAKRNRIVSEENFELRLRGCGHESYLANLAVSHDIAELVSILPPISYEDAAHEVLSADGLLVLQSRDCNNQIPGKVYEYLYTLKPILALSDPKGDTGHLLANEGVAYIAALEDQAKVTSVVSRYLQQELLLRETDISSLTLPHPFEHSREQKAELLEVTLLRLLAPRRSARSA